MRGPEIPTSCASVREITPTRWVRARKKGLPSSMSSYSVTRRSMWSTVSRHFWVHPAGRS